MEVEILHYVSVIFCSWLSTLWELGCTAQWSIYFLEGLIDVWRYSISSSTDMRKSEGRQGYFLLPAFTHRWWTHLLCCYHWCCHHFLASELRFFSLLTRIEDEQLPRNLSGLQQQIGTTEESGQVLDSQPLQ